jgi:DegV family protein with EDD domain
MGKVGFVTDSTVNMPPELIEKYDIRVVPIQVIFADKTYKEGIDLTAKEFYARLAQLKEAGEPMPTTSQPTPADFVAAYQELIDEGVDEIISIHVTAKSSGTCATAELAKDMVKGAHITVVDSATTSMQMGYMLLEAIKVVEAGGSVEEALAAIEEVKAHSCLFFTVTELEHLRRSGRTFGAKEAIEAEVKVKPVVAVADGVPQVVDKVRTQRAGLNHVVELVKEKMADLKIKGLSIVHGNVLDKALAFQDQVKDEFDYDGEIIVTDFGPALAVHFGPGLLGLIAYGE